MSTAAARAPVIVNDDYVIDVVQRYLAAADDGYDESHYGTMAQCVLAAATPNAQRLTHSRTDFAPSANLQVDLNMDNLDRAHLWRQLAAECHIHTVPSAAIWMPQTLADVTHWLQKTLDDANAMSPAVAKQLRAEDAHGRMALLFAGQGAQQVGMGCRAAQLYPSARALFDVASKQLGYNLLALCTDGPQHKLNATNVAQPALLTASLAMYERYKAEQPTAIDACVAVAGLSLGEYAALVAAHCLTFEDALSIVVARGEAMQRCSESQASAMASVLGLSSHDAAVQLLDEVKQAAATAAAAAAE